jgi:hypothetical protein
MKYGVALALPALILFAACSSLKRYSSVEQAGTDNSLADIDLFGFRLSRAKPDGGSKTLWDLSADAQSQYIKILNARYPDNEKFLEAMSQEYLTGDIVSSPDEYVRKDLRMIFSISRRRDYVRKISREAPVLSAADRIEYVKISFRVPEDSGIRFTGWNMFTTEYGTINIADLSFSRSLEIDATGLLSSSRKEPSAEITAGGTSSLSRKEDQTLKYRYIMLNGRMNKNGLEMEEEGTREIDLTGNISADISLEFDKHNETITRITGLQDSTGKFNPADKLTIRHSDIPVPMMDKTGDTIFADLRMDYIFRNVVSGEKTFQEWDDRIKYFRGSVTKSVPLLTSDDYIPEFSCIGTGNDPERREILRMISSDNNGYAVIFRTAAEAVAFYEWLDRFLRRDDNRQKTVTISGYTLKIGDKELTGDLYLSHPDLKVTPYYFHGKADLKN